MNQNNLKFEVIWKDDDMFEMRISANNGRYSGITEVYEVSNSLLGFVNELNGFPFGKDKVTSLLRRKRQLRLFRNGIL